MNRQEAKACKEAALDKELKELRLYIAQGERMVKKIEAQIEAGEEIDRGEVMEYLYRNEEHSYQPAGESNTHHHDSALSCYIL